jgi:phosphopantetheinyl transferase
MMIVLHCARVPDALTAAVAAGWLKRLPRARAHVLSRRLAAGTGLESLTGLALLAGCASAAGLPALSQLTWNRRGKPGWPEGPPFSIAHAGGYAVCAVAPADIAIGVDIEPAGRVRNQTLRLVATPAERAEVERGALDATALWTCKEAVLKAAGAGISDVRRVSIAGDSGHLDGVHYHLTRQSLDGGLLLAIATSHAQPAPRVRWPDAARLFALSPSRGRRRVA